MEENEWTSSQPTATANFRLKTLSLNWNSKEYLPARGWEPWDIRTGRRRIGPHISDRQLCHLHWESDDLSHSNLNNISWTYTIIEQLAGSSILGESKLSPFSVTSGFASFSVGAFCSHPARCSPYSFLFNLKPGWEEGSTCSLTCVSWNSRIFFPNVGLISIIRKTKEAKPPVSSELVTLLVIGTTIEKQDKTKNLEIALKRVIHQR